MPNKSIPDFTILATLADKTKRKFFNSGFSYAKDGEIVIELIVFLYQIINIVGDTGRAV